MNDSKMIKEVSLMVNQLFEKIDNSYDGIILDELLDAISLSLINEQLVYDRLVSLKDNHEVILTGRMPSNKLKVIFDYSSEIKKLNIHMIKELWQEKELNINVDILKQMCEFHL